MSGWERKKAHHSTGMYIEEKVPTSLFAYDNSPHPYSCKPPSGPFGKRKLCPADPAASAHARSSACVPDALQPVWVAGACGRHLLEAMPRGDVPGPAPRSILRQACSDAESEGFADIFVVQFYT